MEKRTNTSSQPQVSRQGTSRTNARASASRASAPYQATTGATSSRMSTATSGASRATAPRESGRNAHANQGTFFGSRTDIGLVRTHNEDSLIALPPLFAVADGMGGHEAGEIASEITISSLAELAPRHPDAAALSRAVETANLNVIKAPSQGIGREGMGNTLTAAILEGERLLIAQVGDSRAYLLQNGRIQQITRDHSLMTDMIEAGQLTPEEARFHPNRSVITRAIGSDPYMVPDLYELNVNAGDRILLCSDGLNSMIDDAEIESILRRVPNPQLCADKLVNAALRAGGQDNVTVIVIDVQGFKHVKERKAKLKQRGLIAILGVVLAAILALAGVGGYMYVNNSAYLIEENGMVSIYKGVPDTLLGMPLSSLDHTTTVEVNKLQPGVANRIKEGLRVEGIEEANRLVALYEEEIRNASATPTPTTNANDANTTPSANEETPSTEGGE